MTIKDCCDCVFLEADGDDCLISGKSGFKYAEERHILDSKYDEWKPCRFYLEFWDEGRNALIEHCERRGKE